MIESLSKKLGLENAVSSFYEFMSRTFPQKKSYVGIQYVKNIIGSYPLKDEMRYIFGVTLKHYLGEVYLLHLYEGSKLKKKMRLGLLKKARTITSLLF